jgi:hypothetical protein
MSTFPSWLDGARVAPSRFNTQPWRFDLEPNGDIVAGWDPQRTLPASDPTGRDLFLSLGAAVESACLRAAAAGAPLAFVPAADEEIDRIGRLTPIDTVDDRAGKRLTPYLDERRTARTRHLRFPVPPVVQLALRRETVGWGCRLHIVTEVAAIQRLAALVRHATIEQYEHRETRVEMAGWCRLTARDADDRQDGVTSECLELHGLMLTLARWALTDGELTWAARWCAARIMALREWTIARHSAAFCLLTAQSSDRVDMVRAGRLLIRLWLLASEAGLSTHAVSPILRSAALSERCLDVFNARGAVPACVFRIGFCPPVAASKRLPPAQLVRETRTTRVTTGQARR